MKLLYTSDANDSGDPSASLESNAPSMNGADRSRSESVSGIRPLSLSGSKVPIRKTNAFDGTVPDPQKIKEDYKDIIATLTKNRPFSTPRLKDLLSRVIVSVERLDALKDLADKTRNAEAQLVLDDIKADVELRSKLYDPLIDMLKRFSDDASASHLVLSPKDEHEPMKSSSMRRRTDSSAPNLNSNPKTTVFSWLKRRVASPPPSEDTHVGPSPIRVKFPIEEGNILSSKEAIAAKLGLPYGRAAADSGSIRWPFLLRIGRMLTLAACGGIFGLSVGVLTGIVDPKILAIAPDQAVIPVSIVVGLGASIFSAIGRVIYLLSALASESKHESWLARANKYTMEDTSAFLNRSANVILSILIFAGLFLLLIDSTTERYGVIKVIMDGFHNSSLMGAPVMKSAPSALAVACLSLIVSAPFILLEGVEGWVESRKRAIDDHLNLHQRAGAHAKAMEIWEERMNEDRDRRKIGTESGEDKTADVIEIKAGGIDAPDNAEAAHESMPSTRSSDSDSNVMPTASSTDTASPVIVASSSPTTTSVNPDSSSSATTPVNVGETSAWISSVPDLIRQLRVNIAQIDARIANHKNKSLPAARSLLSAELADAWNDCLIAVRLFDNAYQREARLMEARLRPGFFRRIWRNLFGKEESLQ